MYLIFKIKFDCFIAKRNIGTGVIVLRISNFHYIYKLCCKKKLPFWSGGSWGEDFFYLQVKKLFTLHIWHSSSRAYVKKCFFLKVYGQTDRQWRLEKNIWPWIWYENDSYEVTEGLELVKRYLFVFNTFDDGAGLPPLPLLNSQMALLF